MFRDFDKSQVVENQPFVEIPHLNSYDILKSVYFQGPICGIGDIGG